MTLHRCAPLLVLLSVSTLAVAQVKLSGKKQPPASLTDEPYVILDSVVTEQWPAMLPLVNVPGKVSLVNPGQCIRVAALASGDGHERFFNGATLAWGIRLAGKEELQPAGPIDAVKQIKPEGSDFVLAALQAGGIKENPIPSYVSIATSSAKWCVPQGAGDGTAEVYATVRRGDQSTPLKAATLQIESLKTAAGKTFKDEKDFEAFFSAYHAAPEPGRLLPAFQFLVASNPQSLIPFAFFRAAFAHDAATVQGFGPGLGASPKLAEMLALNLIAKAGVKLTEPPPLTDEDRKTIAESADIPDAYDMKPDEALFQKLDFLWADFSATGRPQPVAAVVSALGWRSDYEAFDAMRKSGKKPDGLTPSLVRGVTYTAAGWSLNSFQQHDPVAADYLNAISASASTSPAIKLELSGLGTNAAFKRQE